MRLSPIPLCATMVLAGSSAWFVVSTVAMDQVPDGTLMAAALLVALVFVSAFAGTPIRERIKAAGTRETALAALAGILAWFAPFMLVLTQRATDAPSGTEMLFFTTAGWLLAAIVVALFVRAERPSPTLVTGALLAVLGSATLLANWERPSSFSPFIKFPVQESLIVVAGVLFAVGLLMGRRSARVLGARSALWVGVASAALIAVLVAIPSGFGTVATYGRVWPQLLLLGAALATLATGASALMAPQGLVRAVSWIALTPVALTGLSAVERLTGAYGPNPIVWAGALAGALLVCLGVLVVQTSPARPSAPADEPVARHQIPRWQRLLAVGLAATASVAGFGSLFLPAFSASVAGTVESGAAFSAGWVLVGAESAVGWLPLSVGLLALAVALDLRRAGSLWSRLVAALSGVVALATYPLVLATPLHTWNHWIPAEIQQAYGTEYARLTLDVAPQPIRLTAVVIAGIACATLIVIMTLGRDDDGAARFSAHKESE